MNQETAIIARERCPLLILPGEDVLENAREKAAMEGLKLFHPVHASRLLLGGSIHMAGCWTRQALARRSCNSWTKVCRLGYSG